MKFNKSSKRFFIILLGIVAMLSMGTIYSWSIFRTPLENSMSLTHFQSGLPFLVFLSLYAFSMPLAGKFIEQFSPVLLGFAGSIILSFGYFLSGFCSSLSQLVFTYGVLGGIGVGVLYGVPIAMANRWFPGSRGIATGLTLLGFGLSPLITAPLISFLINNFGTASTFKILGLLFLMILPVISIFFTNPSDYTRQKHKIPGKNSYSLVKCKSFYMLWLLFFIVTFSGIMTISITSPFSQEILKLSDTEAAVVISILALFNGLGRVFFGFLIDKLGLRVTMLSTFLLLIVSSLLIVDVASDTPEKFIISISILWGIFGGWLTIAPVSVIKLFGEFNSARNYGKLFTAYGFGAIAGVMLASKVKELTGSFSSVYYAVFALSLVGVFIIKKLYNYKT